VVIVQHSASSVKEYIKAIRTRGHVFAVPDRCPHPDCQTVGMLIYWGFYERNAITEEGEYRIRIQRVRCRACGRTHSLLPDFVHPHRHFALDWLRRVVSLYLLTGLGWRRLMRRLNGQGPARSTVREWVSSFAYGAGYLLFDRLLRYVLDLESDAELPELPPDHLDRVPNLLKRRRLEKAHTFWLLGERLYAQVKTHLPRLHFTAHQFLAFLLHWLQDQRLFPRLFWSPRLHTTPPQPF
jgi:hypothetical protein